MTTTPPPSRRDMPKFDTSVHREQSATAFTQGADTYHDVRPSYPDEVLTLLTDRPSGPILDVGAGTGKLTRKLATLQRDVWALDPSRDMLGQLRASLGVPAWQATAEATALAEGSAAAVVSAQTWHWVDVPRASRELTRITMNGAPLLLVWNTLDVSVPWVHRLTRIMHAGDVQKPGFYPEVTAPWQLAQELRLDWKQILPASAVFQLMATRSYWLRANEGTRAKMTANLQWYLYEHLGHEATSELELPYRCDAFRYEKR